VTIPDQQSAIRNNLSSPGIYVMRVEPGSNAERGGIKPGDRIVSLNGREIMEASQISEVLQNIKVGDALTLVYEREGIRNTASIVMQETIPAELSATKTGN